MTRFDHFNFNVLDLERSLDFYRRGKGYSICFLCRNQAAPTQIPKIMVQSYNKNQKILQMRIDLFIFVFGISLNSKDGRIRIIRFRYR